MFKSFSDSFLDLGDGVLGSIYPRHCPICDKLLPVVEIKNGKLRSGRLIHEACARKITLKYFLHSKLVILVLKI